ncbi:MAG: 5-methyltetrahydropteroyltriglutamate--homocysteine methyltransferase [Gammaproteobacteria bacterium]|jgi:5-methyltetrahydropteroyltriglutamate--homocysteine methyltransferase
MAASDLLRTSVVGSYPQPEWLIDRKRLGTRVPRVRAEDIWRVPQAQLEAAQDDATQGAIRDMELAGVDIITDGEIRRESYSNRFATALEGIDLVTPGTAVGRSGQVSMVPRVVGPIRRIRPVQLHDMQVLRQRTKHIAKITVPGPFTLSMQAHDDYYHDDEALAMDYAAAVNEEVLDLFHAGADIVQLDEPWMQARPEQAKRFAVKAINRALQGAPGTTGVHMCFGYAAAITDKPAGYSFLPELDATVADQISVEAAQPNLDLSVLGELPSKTVLVGVISMGTVVAETPEIVAARIRAALRHAPPQRLIVAPDCGMKYLPRSSAFAKLQAMVAGANIVRRELT